MDISVIHNAEDARYEARLDGMLAGYVAYRVDGSTIVMTHTEVDPAREGQGIGSTLVSSALDDVRGRGLRVRPLCSFVRGYIERHPAYQDLVVAGRSESAVD